jgi:hypothetical protein
MKVSYRSVAHLYPECGCLDYLRSCNLSIFGKLSRCVELLVRRRRSPGLSFKCQLVLLKSYMRVLLLHTHSRVTDYYVTVVASGLELDTIVAPSLSMGLRSMRRLTFPAHVTEPGALNISNAMMDLGDPAETSIKRGSSSES